MGFKQLQSPLHGIAEVLWLARPWAMCWVSGPEWLQLQQQQWHWAEFMPSVQRLNDRTSQKQTGKPITSARYRCHKPWLNPFGELLRLMVRFEQFSQQGI